MGQIVYALIEHPLTTEEIFEFPQKLEACPNGVIAGRWNWTDPNFDINSFFKSWNAKQIDFASTYSWSEQDFPWLQKGDLTLDFFKPNLIAFDNLFKWFFFQGNERRINDFSKLTRDIANLLNATDLLFVRELTDDFINSNDHLTVDLFRQDAKDRNETVIEVR
jgi:hypothetical protein